MVGSVNKVILVGNVGKDPEIRNTQSGDRVATFPLATSERWKDKVTGERKEKTEWHRIVIFDDRLVEVIEKFVHKGSKIYVEGQLQTRKWSDQSGQEKYTTEVVLQRFRGELTLLDTRGGGDNHNTFQNQNQEMTSGMGEFSRHKTLPSHDTMDDDIPF
ncbi:MAG: single-stranded DNA-binding protein [Alphaproteobacteria bacterium]|nr:single-stranded DNA-binding protein [Alphaproteobacteria bacterium]